MPKAPNRLAGETSPYLLQHAHNPVDWYPWGDEAFAAARAADKPIFLSIGYSTCYWCHVMERESFEDDATAAVLNEHFIAIKLDREQRPEIDDVYMTATQLMTGSGGWPMSVFLEPEQLRPFWCGTYFPREPRQGLPSFKQVLKGMADAYVTKRDDVIAQAEQLADAVRSQLSERAEPVALNHEHVAAAVGALLQQHDAREGGFGGQPKFPQPVYLELLQAARDHAGDQNTRTAIDACVKFTLDRMAVGGLFDQVGGGFHRYCVDATWTVPHFEKMLYDNAQLLSVYARAAATYDDGFYRSITRQTAAYVLREMTSPDGGFYSAQDAEVDHREGLNYIWTEDQAPDVLGDDADFAIKVYGLDAPNFRDPHYPDEGPKSVLRLEDRPALVAEKLGLEPGAFDERLTQINATLLAARDERKQPHLDDKVLAAWNGMMIKGLADAAAVLDDSSLLDAAERAAAFVLGAMRDADGHLLRSHRAGASDGEGVLEDSAAMIRGLVALQRAGRGDGRHLEAAIDLANRADDLFGDSEGGGFFDARAGRGDLFIRPRSTYDGATPSGSSQMLEALLDLAEAEIDGPWLDRALAQLRAVSPVIAERGVAIAGSTRGLLRALTSGIAARLADGAAFAPQQNEPADFTPVEIFASTDRVAVGEGSPASFELVLRIKEGYHILAADPIPEGAKPIPGLIPLRVGLVSGMGVAVYADYPEGEPYGPDLGGDGRVLVHTDEVRLTVALERADGVGVDEGTPIMGVTFQACTETACREPKTVELDVAIDLA
ncbi:MAG: thioredoxin domain-containing protein [Planctomycetota bacterium]